MFADYRVPQILRHLGIMEYSEELAQKIDNKVELSYSSEEEVEIRAATITAVDLIAEVIRKEGPPMTNHIKYSYEVDWLLWQMGEKTLNELKEHHRVLSIFY